VAVILLAFLELWLFVTHWPLVPGLID
jgi:hypothetical protein